MIKRVVKAVVPHSVRSIWHMKYCPVRMPWFDWPEQLEPLKRIELEKAWEYRREHGEAIRLYLDPLLWPLVTSARALISGVGARGSHVSHTGGVSRLRQIAHQIYLANRHNIDNDTYYSHRLFKKALRLNAAYFMLQPKFGGVLDALNMGQSCTVLENKRDFYQHCTQHDVPTVPILAVCREGSGVEWIDRANCRLPESDLFLKPVDGIHGEGAESWSWYNGGWERGGTRHNHDQMIKYIYAASRRRDYIIMPCIRNSEWAVRFTGGAVPTLRVITCIEHASRRAWPLASVFRMPVGNMEMDNISAGGIMAAVDGDGRMMAAVADDVCRGQFSDHPDTGESIVGTRIPEFRDAVAICIKAHSTVPKCASVGWDVAFSHDGPMIIEGNDNWHSRTWQIAAEAPLASKQFVEWASDELANGGTVCLTSMRHQAGE